MNAYRYLEQVQEKEIYWQRKIAELKRLEMLETDITAPLRPDPVQTSGNNDKMGTLIVTRLDFEKEVVNKAEADYLRHRKRVIKTLEKVKDINFQQYKILHMRYIEYLTLKKISTKECYSYQRIKEIHRNGVKNVQNILDFQKVHTKTY